MNDDSRYQASAVIAAFRYQLLQSLAAWLGMRPGEALWLEVSEDFSLAAQDTTTDVQVKSSPELLNLRSKGVKQALTRFWDRAQRSAGVESILVFIARGGPARERGTTFPERQPGLRYWRSAAVNADTAPLRAALLDIFAGQPLAKWLMSNPSDEELRARLLRKVQWALEALDAASLEDDIQDRVRLFFDQNNLPRSGVADGTKMLLEQVFKTACEPDPNRRRLTRADLLDTSVRVFVSGTLAAIQKTSITTWIAPQNALVASVPGSGPTTIRRDALIAELLSSVAGEPVIWLLGPNGVGKSTLANLIASREGGEWVALDLRPVQDSRGASLAAWQDLRSLLVERPDAAGVVIHDCNDQAYEVLHSRLGPFVDALAIRGARVIVTSSSEPSAARLAAMSATEKALVRAPYFTIDELRELVSLPGGPDVARVDAWAALIRLTTNGGHPLLAAAKVSNLRARGWPTAALAEDMTGAPSEAVRITREESRRRLLAEVPSESALELLRRLASVYDSVDDQLLRRLGQSDPPIPGLGDAIAVLRGSWIEVTSDGYLRISPLIADLAQDLAQAQSEQCRRVAARHWGSLGPLNNRTLPLCFWNAFLGKEIMVLARVTESIQVLPQEQLRGAAALLFPLVAFSTDRSLLPEHPAIAPLVRLLQFTVADAVSDDDVASAVATRLLVEIDESPIAEIRSLSTSIAAFRVVASETDKIPPAIILEYILRARAAGPELDTLGVPLPSELSDNAGLSGFLFAHFAARVRWSDRLEALVVAMDGLAEKDRGWLLDSVVNVLGDLTILFQNPWANEQLADKDPDPTLARYQHIAEITGKWNRPDVLIEVACARSVILDEMMGDRLRAIDIIDSAVATLGPRWRLIQQKAKVLDHDERAAEAAALYISVEDEIVGKGFDQATAFRGGAVASAKVGRYGDSIRLLQKAQDALEGNAFFTAVSVGLLLERAVVEWRAGNRRSALLAVANALDAIESVDPTTSRQSERVHQFARFVVGVFLAEVKPYPPADPMRLDFGAASALVGDEPLLNINFKPLSDIWRLLALVETEVGADAGIAARSLSKQAGPGLAAIEMSIASARYAHALANGSNLTTVIRLGVVAASSAKAAIDLQGAGSERRMAPNDSVSAHRIADLLSGAWRERLLSIFVDVILWHWMKDRVNGPLVEAVRQAGRQAELDEEAFDPILKAASGHYAVGPNAQAAVMLAHRLSDRFDCQSACNRDP